MPPPDGALEFLGLESCAERISGCGCVVRTYGNFICGAVGITIVIVAILHVALDALDVLAAIILGITGIHFLFPFLYLNNFVTGCTIIARKELIEKALKGKSLEEAIEMKLEKNKVLNSGSIKSCKSKIEVQKVLEDFIESLNNETKVNTKNVRKNRRKEIAKEQL